MISQDRQLMSRGLGLGLSCAVHAAALLLYFTFGRPEATPPKPDDTITVIMLREDKALPARPPSSNPKASARSAAPPEPAQVAPPVPVLTAPPPQIEIARQPLSSTLPVLNPGDFSMAVGDSAAPVGGGDTPVEEPLLDAASWIRKPTAVDWATNFPRKARGVADKARVVLSCRVTAGNRVKDCTVVSEKPSGYGIGQAVIRMSSMFRVKPVEVDGRPQYDLRVRIPLTFVNPN